MKKSLGLFVFAALFCFASCKKDKETVADVHTAILSDSQITFTNTGSGTAQLEFALVRIEQPHILSNGKKNNGYVLPAEFLPMILGPGQQSSLPKTDFVYTNLDTLTVEDKIVGLSYIVRVYDDTSTVITYAQNY